MKLRTGARTVYACIKILIYIMRFNCCWRPTALELQQDIDSLREKLDNHIMFCGTHEMQPVHFQKAIHQRARSKSPSPLASPKVYTNNYTNDTSVHGRNINRTPDTSVHGGIPVGLHLERTSTR
jgi:hypothetical protein